MLSGETAAGMHPIDSVKTMARIVAKTEAATEDGKAGPYLFSYGEDDFSSAICQAAASAAGNLGAKAIACFTESGGTARKLAKFRSPAPVIAMTPHSSVVRQLNLAWGVRGLQVPPTVSTDQMVGRADQELLRAGLVVPGDKIVVILGAPVTLSGSTNLMKLHRVGENDVA